MPKSKAQKLGSPAPEARVSAENADGLIEDKSASACTASAMRLLAFSDRSEKQLCLKLSEKGFERAEIEKTLEFLRSKRYISDRRYMESCARSLALHKLYGRARIARELILRFGKDSFDTHYPELEPSLLEQVDFGECALALARKHRGKDKKYIFAKLKNNGFAYEEVKYALERLEDCDITE